MSRTTVLVTGATGCVGRAVVAAARTRGWRVRGLARRAPRGPWWDDVTVARGDVRHHAAVAAASAGCDAIIHLAGWVHRVPRNDDDLTELRTSIVDGTAAVAAAAATAGAHLVMISTVAVYGPGLPVDGRPAPHTPYGRAKLEAEVVASTACPGAVILRPAVVYGAHDRGNVATLIRAIERRLGIIVGDGANRKSMVYVDNLADRIVATVGRDDLARPWIAADDPAPTQAELIHEISRALGRRRPPVVPRWPVAVVAGAVDLVGRTHFLDRVTRLTQSSEFPGQALDQALGYAPRVAWRDGIRLTIGSRALAS